MVGDAKTRKYLQPFLRGNAMVTPGSLAAANIEHAVNDLDPNFLP